MTNDEGIVAFAINAEDRYREEENLRLFVEIMKRIFHMDFRHCTKPEWFLNGLKFKLLDKGRRPESYGHPYQALWAEHQRVWSFLWCKFAVGALSVVTDIYDVQRVIAQNEAAMSCIRD